MVDAAIESLTRHTWYLTQELITFCLWDKEVPATKRRAVTLRMIECQPSVPLSYLNYLMAVQIGLNLRNYRQYPDTLKFKELVGPRSHLLFHLFQLGSRWLTKHPRSWPEDPEYMRFICFLHDLKVVNDIAERGVKDMGEYRDVTVDGLYMEDILRVVQDHRFVLQNKRKDAMNRVNFV
jgi:hypothetical protein